MWLLEQKMMEIVKLGLALEPNHTVPLSLVDFPGSVSGVATVKPEEPVPSVHFLAYISP